MKSNDRPASSDAAATSTLRPQSDNTVRCCCHSSDARECLRSRYRMIASVEDYDEDYSEHPIARKFMMEGAAKRRARTDAEATGMIDIREQLREDPSLVFSVEFELPSGNLIIGSVRPAINWIIMANVGFMNKPNDQDREDAKEVLNLLLQEESKTVFHYSSKEGLQECAAEIRKLCGGGLG